MNFIFTMTGYLMAAAIAGFILPFAAAFVFQRKEWKTVTPLLFALALVGSCAGLAGGMSRAAAVGDIIPAFLGLLGAVAVYLFGVDQSRGVIASFGAATLSISLFVGYTIGSEYRNLPEDHRDIRAHCTRAYTSAELLKDEAAFERFKSQMGRLCNAAMHWNITTQSDSKEN